MNLVRFSWNRRPSQASAETLRRIVTSALDTLGRTDTDVHVLLTSDEQIRDLNRRYRGRDRPTDVLSFTDGDLLPTGRTLLGEIVISIDTARRQADEAGLDELRELSELTLHGVLHLLGYDHSADGGEMDNLERRLRRELLS